MSINHRGFNIILGVYVARKRKKNSSGGVGTIVGVLLLLGVIASFFGGNNNSSPSHSEKPTDSRKMTAYDFSAKRVVEQSGATSWIFEAEFKPPLILSEPSGFVQSVNKALGAVNLPAISEAVPEREKLIICLQFRKLYQNGKN